MIVVCIKEFQSAAIWCRVKRGKFNRWGILECMILLLNYNTRQVNTELYCTALRLDLRLHYVLDFGCKSSMHSCTSNTDVKASFFLHESNLQFCMMAEALDIVEKGLEELEEEITCPVCQDHFRKPKILPCLHYYCKECV